MARSQRGTTILEAAARWRDECLIEDGSILSTAALWTCENFEALKRHFVDNLDYGEGNFFQKLEAQLKPAPTEAKQLAAELLWVMYLIVEPRSMSGNTKRFQIQKVWNWSGVTLDPEQWALGAPMDHGIVNPGTAYNTHRPREFRFFITTMIDWKNLAKAEGVDLLADPWEFGDWLDEREFAEGRQFRHALLYLLYPEKFEASLSGIHKSTIVKKLTDPKSIPSGFPASGIAVDRLLLEVRERVEQEHPGESVSFYDEPYRSMWRSPAKGRPRVPATEVPSGIDYAQWFKDRFGDVRIWAVGTGKGGRLWSSFQSEGIAAIGWDALEDLARFNSKDEVREALKQAGAGENPVMDTLALWQFSHDIQPGDIILAKKGRFRLLGWGKVTSGYRYDPTRPEFHHVIEVDWQSSAPVDIPKNRGITGKTLTDFSPYLDWVHFAFQLFEGRASEAVVEPIEPTYSLDDALSDLFVDPLLFQRALDGLSLRKNLILQGPPGVGKTFIARRIAWALIGREAPECIEMVQFHQSYAYEDFVMGWRPTEEGGFKIRNGVFYEFCNRAKDAPETAHVFIIDEINRGNLSRIFGELLMLIEGDKRGEDHAMQLTYSDHGERFWVPENVYILGMMNTADRSLAMVDYALRRRFAFISLEPAFGSEAFERLLIDAGAEASTVTLIVDRMSRLNDKIRGDKKNLGPGFELGHSYFVPTNDDDSLDDQWFQGIVRTQIEPLLREYWFDQPEQVERMLEDLL